MFHKSFRNFYFFKDGFKLFETQNLTALWISRDGSLVYTSQLLPLLRITMVIDHDRLMFTIRILANLHEL